MIRREAEDDASKGERVGERNARTGWDVDVMLKLKKRWERLGERRASQRRANDRLRLMVYG